MLQFNAMFLCALCIEINLSNSFLSSLYYRKLMDIQCIARTICKTEMCKVDAFITSKTDALCDVMRDLGTCMHLTYSNRKTLFLYIALCLYTM